MNTRPRSRSHLRNSIAASVIAGLLSVVGCDKTCDAPDKTTYSCEPLPSGSAGCKGGASLGTAAAPDPDKVYPVGCVAQLPFCVAAYPGSVQTCSCTDAPTGDGGTAPRWVCPI